MINIEVLYSNNRVRENAEKERGENFQLVAGDNFRN